MLTFRGHRIYSAIHLDKTNTHGTYIIAIHIKLKKVIRGERFR